MVARSISTSTALGDHTNPSTVRDKPELSNLAKVSSGYVDGTGKVHTEFESYRHSSYPPIKLKGGSITAKMKRREGAVAAVHQMLTLLLAELIKKDPALYDVSRQPVEIRLSSMLLLTPLFKDQAFMKADSEMRQLKDSLIALNMVNQQIIALEVDGKPVVVKPFLTQMNMPSNTGMKHQHSFMGGEFNDEVNRKGFYEYTENFLAYISKQSTVHPEVKNITQNIIDAYCNNTELNKLKSELKALQETLDLPALYKALGELQKDPQNVEEYKEKLKEIRAAEKKLNTLYKAIITQQKIIWDNLHETLKSALSRIEALLKDDPNHPAAQALQVTALFLDASEIFYNKKHKKIKQGYQFQTRYILANYLMGNSVEFFCKSGEDRTGRLNNHIEEFLAYRRTHGIFPKFKDKAAVEELKQISQDVHHGSVSKEITDQNAPGARGLQQSSGFGANASLELSAFDRKMGQLGKKVAQTRAGLKNSPDMFSNIPTPLQNNLISVGKTSVIHPVPLQQEINTLTEEIREIFSKEEEKQHTIEQAIDRFNTSLSHEFPPSELITFISGTKREDNNKLSTTSFEEIVKAKLTPVLKEYSGNFSIEPDKKSQPSTVIMKEHLPFMSITPTEIQSANVCNKSEDYNIMLKAALALYQKPLLIYIPEAEKDKLEAALRTMHLDKQDFIYTTNYEDYQLRQRLKETSERFTSKDVQPQNIEEKKLY